MVRVIAFGVNFIGLIIEIVFSLFGMIAAILGASIALALCILIGGGLVAILSFFLAIFG